THPPLKMLVENGPTPPQTSVNWFTSPRTRPQEVEDGQGGQLRDGSSGSSSREDEHSRTGPQVSPLATEDPRDPGSARAEGVSAPRHAVDTGCVQAGDRRDFA